ncbi:Spore protein SP21 [Paraliobacillus sp. PM-2]|uniref:Hsp20/alpha crystallin family protein n=1 Tax=Paraliobacillus sp. PM-2 TaxID=1462524 RepID=UPI00061BF157|nr:Hsp20/alpha crystallin family protein [Paraliobacillus sp. PM-2]CQR46099.1 Spore protein SP21 [Paraliobacillus sp. PM-2]
MDEHEKRSELVEAGQDFVRKMDELFYNRPKNNILNAIDSFFQQSGLPSRLAIDVFETETEWVAQVDLPGVKKENIHVDIIGDRLKIMVDYNEETNKSNENKDYYHRERKHQHAERMVQLPYVVDKKTTKASFRNGVLEVRGPKKKKPNNYLEID